jgi:hypothetical protein
MNPKMKIALAITAVGAFGLTFAAIRLQSFYSQIVNRFTEYDPKVVRKAYTNMLKKAFAGQYGNVDFDNDAVMTALFRKEVMNLLNK